MADTDKDKDEQNPTPAFNHGASLALVSRGRGRPVLWSEPEALLTDCLEYMDWVEANPLYEAKAFAYEGTVTVAPVAKMRAMTVGGLCIFLGIDQSTWRDYRGKADFSGVCSRVEEMIREQKFTGASAGLLNHAIIARDLGLADKRELSGPDGGPMKTITSEMTPLEAAQAWADALRANNAD